MLERHIAVLQETIKKALSDADSEARARARKWVDVSGTVDPVFSYHGAVNIYERL